MLKAINAKIKAHKLIGNKAEDIAKTYLKNKGLEFITQNYHSRMGEIDLIFKESHNTLVFIEVKYRSTTRFGHADEMVNIHKQRKIIKTASSYLQKNKLTESVIARFDVIAIEPASETTAQVQMNNIDQSLSIQWVKNAFQAM